MVLDDMLLVMDPVLAEEEETEGEGEDNMGTGESAQADNENTDEPSETPTYTDDGGNTGNEGTE